MTPNLPEMPAPVAAAYDAMPGGTRAVALRLRSIIFAVAAQQRLPQLQETLRWGEPAYLPGKPGTTVRIGWDRQTGDCKLLVHCRTSLVEGWRSRFGDGFRFDGNRAVIVDRDPDEAALGQCVAEAFAYHRS